MPRSSTAIRGDGSKKRRRKPGLSNPRQSSAVTLDQNTTDGEIWGSSMAGTNENDAPTSLLELSENFDGHVQGSLVTGTSERGVPIKGDGPKKRGRKPGVSHPRRCETKTLAQSTIDEEIPAMAGNGDTEAPVKGDCPRKRGRKPGVSYPIKSKARALNQDTVDEESHGSSMASDSDNGAPVALFESSEKFLKFCDQLWLMYGASVDDSRWAQAKERFSSSVNFVQEWRQYWNEESKTLRFIHEGGSQHVNDNKKVIVLPQFSSAAVPKIEKVSPEITKITNSSNDFVMQVGGSVWALDWCPKTHQGPQSLVKCEYLAISAHPPDCSFHKIGVPLSGRGMIQLWSLLNVSTKGDSLLPQKSRVRKMTDRSETVDDVMEGTCGRAWTLNEGSMPGTSNIVGGPTTTTHIGFNHTDSSYLQDTVVSKGRSRIKDKARAKASDNISQMGSLALIEMNKTSTAQMYGNKNGAITKVDSVSAVLSKELAYPRIALCLTHEGKVAWDVKWRPPNGKDMENDESLGFMAVVLGDGSIQVWEIPSPVMLKSLYGCKSRKGTDPRFVKLLPVFKCSKLQCGNRQSIPLTVEWSPTIPHDLILVGCHDGMVALWKFSASGSSKDTRPILCFTADDLPIRALAWCPAESDEESSIFFATAGHSGSLRFWDIRDPFRPLWDLHLSRAVILSIDWSKDPRCVILSLDDGSLRILSLLNATSHVPVTGKPFVGTPLQGLQSYFCSPFAIWSVQISQATGLVAYCGVEGSAIRFQLTSKAVDKGSRRYRTLHYLSGSICEEGSILKIMTAPSDKPVRIKLSANEFCDTPTSVRVLPPDGDGPSTPTLSSSKKRQTSKPNVGKQREEGAGSQGPVEEAAAAIGTIESGMGEEMRSDMRKIGVGETSETILTFPPKIVAMHRVRWNNNKGSERWLCFGGAAGIVRCQEIPLPMALK